MPALNVMGLHARSGTRARIERLLVSQLWSLEAKAQSGQGLFLLRPLSLVCMASSLCPHRVCLCPSHLSSIRGK